MDNFQGMLESAVGHLYGLERELGGGGMSRVWLAREKSLGRAVVIKVLEPETAAAVSTARFRREIELCARLQHPQIVPLLSAGEAGGLPYYTMPYVEGESLRRRLRRGEPLAYPHIVHVLRDVALALEHAHRQGVIHRDIKPENILLVGRSAMVTDFGIAKALTEARAESDLSLTRAGTEIGTPAYMAPEQMSGDSVDHRADIYAWGLVAYELLSGAHPFAHCKNGREYLRAHLNETPVALGERDANLPPHLTALVTRCLAKSPADRPSSALEIIKVLELAGGATGDYPALDAKRWISRRALIAVGAAIVLASVIVVVSQGRRPGAFTAKSIAVIPFANASDDSTQDYFADGMADELSTELGRVPGLRVASRTAAYRFKGRRDLDVREVRRTLGVDVVVQGTVRRASNLWRVSTHLTDAVTGEEIWSERYDRGASDVFAVQDDICANIARALRLRFMVNGDTRSAVAASGVGSGEPSAGSAPPVQGTRNVAAYDLYLRGRYLLERRGPAVRLAVDLFSQALTEDSLFARAHASRALALLLAPFYTEAPVESVLARAEASSRRALELDPKLADGYLAMAGVHRLRWNWTEALNAFRVALQLDPRNVPARLNYSQLLYAVGEADASLDQARRAKALDPYSALALLGEARILTLFGFHREAVSLVERASKLDPALPQTRGYLALLYLRRGDSARALTIVDSAPPIPSIAGELAYVTGAAGDPRRVQGSIQRLRMQAGGGPFKHSAVALAYLGIGDTSRALDEFQLAAKQRELFPLNVGFIDPIYDPIRGSLRFATIVRSYGLDDRRFANVAPSGSARPPR